MFALQTLIPAFVLLMATLSTVAPAPAPAKGLISTLPKPDASLDERATITDPANRTWDLDRCLLSPELPAMVL